MTKRKTAGGVGGNDAMLRLRKRIKRAKKSRRDGIETDLTGLRAYIDEIEAEGGDDCFPLDVAMPALDALETAFKTAEKAGLVPSAAVALEEAEACGDLVWEFAKALQHKGGMDSEQAVNWIEELGARTARANSAQELGVYRKLTGAAAAGESEKEAALAAGIVGIPAARVSAALAEAPEATAAMLGEICLLRALLACANCDAERRGYLARLAFDRVVRLTAAADALEESASAKAAGEMEDLKEKLKQVGHEARELRRRVESLESESARLAAARDRAIADGRASQAALDRLEASLEKARMEAEAAGREDCEVLIDKLTAAADAAGKRAEGAESQLAKANERIDSLGRELDDERRHRAAAAEFVQVSEGAPDAAAIMPAADIESFPKTCREAAELAMRAFANLDFAPGALDSAAEWPRSAAGEVWAVLRGLALNADDCFFTQGTDPQSLFAERTGFQLAMREGRLTSRNAKCRRDRRLLFEGREYDMTPHVKGRGKPDESIRVHFAVDSDRKRLVIGHIGAHLRTSETAKSGKGKRSGRGNNA